MAFQVIVFYRWPDGPSHLSGGDLKYAKCVTYMLSRPTHAPGLIIITNNIINRLNQ